MIHSSLRFSPHEAASAPDTARPFPVEDRSHGPGEGFMKILRRLVTPNGEGQGDLFALLGTRSSKVDSAMVGAAVLETANAMKVMSKVVHPSVFVCGGARMKEYSPEFPAQRSHYQATRNIGESLATLGFAVQTGGGPGAMEAANRGAYEAWGKATDRSLVGESISVAIKLKYEEHPNPYVHHSAICKYFFPRKVVMTKYSVGAVMMPGGMGTLDEFFEVQKLASLSSVPYPIALVGDYYKPLYHWLTEDPSGPLKQGMISPDALKYLKWVENEAAAAKHIQENSAQGVARFHDRQKAQRTRNAELFEQLAEDPKEREGWMREFGGVDFDMLRNMSDDLLNSFEAMSFWPDVAVTVSGSATENDSNSEWLGVAQQTGAIAAQRGLSVMTARATGLMGAANEGAVQGAADDATSPLRPYSLMCGRTRKHSDGIVDARLDDFVHTMFDFTNKVALLKFSCGTICLPSGLGGLDWMAEAKNLEMTGKVEGFPIVLLGKKYWDGLYKVLEGFVDHGYMNHRELASLRITDSPEEAVNIVLEGPKACGKFLATQRRLPLPILSSPSVR